jgi:hypothetical protein
MIIRKSASKEEERFLCHLLYRSIHKDSHDNISIGILAQAVNSPIFCYVGVDFMISFAYPYVD